MSEIKKAIRDLRIEYTQAVLSEHEVNDNPFIQFESWMEEAIKSSVNEPNAMHLATISSTGRPAGRVVLLRGITQQGFVFFTNYDSKKGQDLATHPVAALTFFWPELERQIRIEGVVEQISAADSDAYFYSRPRGNRLGAWASPQSKVIDNRDELDRLSSVMLAKFPGDAPIPRPAHWGGYRVRPDSMEFWQGRASRLHDRIRYIKSTQGWLTERLAP